MTLQTSPSTSHQDNTKTRTHIRRFNPCIDGIKIVLNEEEEEEATGLKEPKEKNDTFPSFTVQLDDTTWNSSIEFLGSTADPNWNLRLYLQTHAQNIALGIAPPSRRCRCRVPNTIKKMKEAVDKVVTEQSAGKINDGEFPCSLVHWEISTRPRVQRSPSNVYYLL